MSEAPELLVPIDAPAAPFVLADSKFISTLSAVEKQATELVVSDHASAQVAADLQIRLTGAGKKLEETRVSLSRPFLDAQRKIAEVAREPAARIEATKKQLKDKLSAYDAEQKRIAAEAEKARQAEIRRLDAIRAAEIKKEEERLKELQKIAEEAAAKAVPTAEAPLCLDDDEPPAPPIKTGTQVALEVLRHTPAVVAPKPIGVAMRVTLVATVTDVNALPEPFCERVPKLAAIRATYCVGWREGQSIPECPGVAFTVNREPVPSGRRTF